MATTVTGLTKERMEAIEGASIVNGEVDESGDLILTRHDETSFNAGHVKGADATALMTIADSTSIDLSLAGEGTPASPWELGAQLRSQEVTDWNDATAPGFYWAVDPLNAPASGSGYWWIGYVYRHEGSGRPIQEIRRSNSALMQSRFVRYWTGVAWTEWLLDGGQGQGTTAARDLLFTPPTTDTERVALANRKIRWYNTDLGWEESYYAPTGLAGLTAQGLVAGTASGWYPTGEGPYAVYEPTTTFLASTGSYLGNWHNGNKRRKGGDAWFTAASDGFITVYQPGIYDVKVWTQLTSGSGTANFHLRVLTGTTVDKQVDGLAFTLLSSLAIRMHGEYWDAPINAGQKLGLFCHSGNLTVHSLALTPRAQFEVRYKGPLLTTD